MLAFQLLYIVATLIAIAEFAISQTDVSSFGITTGSGSTSTEPLSIKLSLSWNLEQWQCLIGDAMIEDDTYYFCTSGDFEPNATLITNALSANAYEMKIELLGNASNDAIRVASIKVLDDDTNYYEIDTFCMAKQFRYTPVGSSSLTSLECCYWSQRAAFDTYLAGWTPSIGLKISYAQFRYNVLDFPNQASEGAIKPPKIKEIGITTLSASGSGSTSTYSLTLHWDSQEYQWTSMTPSQPNATYFKSFSDATSDCEFSSGFSLQMSTSMANSVGIASIAIRDETQSEYNIEHFCFADDIPAAQRYGGLNEECTDEWSGRTKYDGFLYNTTNSVNFVWSQRVFTHANEAQQGLVIHDDVHTRYTCNSNAHRTLALFKDDMDSPTSTGWVFEGAYVAGLNAVNCPGGSADKCARLAGYQSSSTTIDSSMSLTIDVSQSVNLQIQYDLSLSTMPSGKSCCLDYTFDDNAWSSGQCHTSSGTSLQLLLNQTYTVPTDHIDLGYINLTIRFWNDALYDNEYCYVDHFDLFADRVVDFDECDVFDGTWTYTDASIASGSSYCSSSAYRCMLCTESTSWIKKQYNSINNYNGLILRVDLRVKWRLFIYYSYDNEPETLLTNPSSSPTAYSVYYPTSTPSTGMYSRPNEEFAIPDAKLCGASTLYISFRPYTSYDFSVDNLILYGNILDTADPTTSPTLIPTNPPTSVTPVPTIAPTRDPTVIPTSMPTQSPSATPTQVPSASPTQTPTMSPSYNPTITTAAPTTRDPTTSAPTPTRVPSHAPTRRPTVLPSRSPTDAPSHSPINSPTLSSTDAPSHSPTDAPRPTNTPIITAPSRSVTLAPTVVPVDAFTPDPAPTPTKRPNPSPISSFAQYFTECNAFTLEITSSLNPPQLMYKNVLLQALVINSTKHAIVDHIRISYVYNVSQFGDPWDSFVIYSLEENDIDDGVDFRMEYCSYHRNFTDYISRKMQLDYDNEIGQHTRLLLQGDQPLNIPDARVRITSIEGANPFLCNDAGQLMLNSEKQKFEIVLACLVASLVLLFVTVIVIILQRMKYRKHDDNSSNDDVDHDVPVPGDERSAEAKQQGDDDFVVSAVEMQMHDAKNQVVQVQAGAATNQQNGEVKMELQPDALFEHEGEVMNRHGWPAEAQNPFDIEDDPIADFDIVGDINQTIFD